MRLFTKLDSYIKKERTIMDAKDASWKLLFLESTINGSWGFFVGIAMAFVAMYVGEPTLFNAVKTFISLIIVYSFESEIINRKGYTTRLGKRIIYPFPKAIGGLLGVTITAVFF